MMTFHAARFVRPSPAATVAHPPSPKALTRWRFVSGVVLLIAIGLPDGAFAAQGCGNGVCDAGETKQSCPRDCRRLLKLLRQRRERPANRAGRAASEASQEPLGPGDQRGTLMVGGRSRTYLLHAPSSHDGTKARPLVLVFHGAYGTGAVVAQMSGFSDSADREQFLVAYPDGIERSWNDGRGTTAADQQAIDDVGFVSALIDHLAQQFPIDPNRIYAAGMSNGAIFSFRLGCELSDRFAAMAAVAGMMAESIVPNCAPSAPISVLILKGTADPLTPYEGGKTRKGQGGPVFSAPASAEFWAKHNGCHDTAKTVALPQLVADGTSVERMTRAGCHDGSEVVLYTVKGMGHAWPPHPPHVPKISGNTSHNIDATEVIWEFFKRHAKEG